MKKVILQFWRDDRGQSTTEYILILSVVVMIALKFKKTFSEQLDKLLGNVSKDLDEASSQSGK
jgi:Flp pilus assembly pilin Flp